MTSIEAAASDLDGSSSDRYWRYFWLLLLIAATPMLIPYFYEMWRVSWYRYFPFVIIAVVGLAYARSDGKFYPPRTWLHWSAIGVGVLLIIASAILQFTWFAALGAFLIGATCLSVMKGPKDSSLLVLAVPLMMIVRLPLRTDHMLVTELQGVTTWLSSVMLDVAGAPHAVAGNVIQLANKELFVAEACSGIQSVFTLAFLACLLVAIKRRRIWLVPLYLVVAIFLAIAANVIRVTTVALAEVWLQLDLTQGWPHETVGYFALGIAVLFLLSFDQLIVMILHTVSDLPSSNPVVRFWNRSLALRDEEGQEILPGDPALSSPAEARPGVTLAWLANPSTHKWANQAFVAAMVLVAVFSVAQVWRSRRPGVYAADAKSIVYQPPVDLVDSLGYLKVTGHQATRGFSDPRLGANSDIWDCEAGDLEAQLVLSQPHTGWHELCVCYERQDWLLVNRQLTDPVAVEQLDSESEEADPNDIPIVIARFKKTGLYGYLFFAGIGSDGMLVPSPTSLSAFTHRVWNRIDTTGVWEQNEVLMLQLWVVSPQKLDPETVELLKNDFVQVRSKVSASVTRARQQPGDSELTAGQNGAGDTIAYQSPPAVQESSDAQLP